MQEQQTRPQLRSLGEFFSTLKTWPTSEIPNLAYTEI